MKRFDIYLVNLDEEVSKDAKNSRPCVVISPDEMNDNVPYVIVAPVSSGSAAYPTRIPIDLLKTRRYIVLDQIHAVDTERLVKKIGDTDAATRRKILETLQEFFGE